MRTRIILGGDVMLGRLVKDAILTRGIDFPMGQIAPIMKQGDLTIVNLECAVTSNPHIWSGAPKAFYFGAPPEAAKILANCGIHLVSLANNHILDYDVKGLFDSLKYLKQQKISYAGAGENEDEAFTPAYLTVKKIKYGFAAFCDHQKDFSAKENSPGMAYINLADEEHALNQIQLSLSKMQKAQVDYPILSLHWGPNMVLRPSTQFVRIAHTVIEMGYKLVFGHSAHVFHGIEIYRHCPIIYSAGDLVDDYYVDPDFKNDHQLLFEIELVDTTLQRIVLHPVFTEYCQTKPANEEQFAFIAKRIKMLCEEMGTTVKQRDQHTLIINI